MSNSRLSPLARVPADAAQAAPVPLMEPRRVYEQWGPQAEKAVVGILRGHGYVRGPEVAGLEQAFQERLGVAHAVAVDSGTDALTLVLRAVLAERPPEAREVIVPTFTFVATAGAVVNAGGTPVFADVCEDTQNMDPVSVAARLSPATAALVPVHLYGAPADLAGIARALPPGSRRPFVLEDAAQAIDATIQGRAAGALTDAAAFSFYPSKNLGAAGDGGLVTTGDEALAARVRALRDHGQTRKLYDHERVGTNSRMDEIQAAVLRAKLPYLSSWTQARRDIAARYSQAFEGSPVQVQRVLPGHASAWHLFTVRVPDRERTTALLTQRRIGHGVYYPVPLHRQPCFAAYAPAACPVADRLAQQVLSLPCFPGLEPGEQERVIQALLDAHA